MQLVLPLIKADAERHIIVARAVHEIPDKANEIFDYESSKPNIEAWSKSFSDATNGLSKGNVRVMHTKVVAGRVDEISFNDDEKAVDVVMKIVDDNEWKKVEAGLYTGVSIGGAYGKKWKDGNYTRYTAQPSEISLVDSPCIPTARFLELHKADGVVSEIELVGHVPTFSEMWKSAPPVQTFAHAWAARPMTFAEMHKRGI